MASSRRGGRREPLSIWPGFVDAFTTLLLRHCLRIHIPIHIAEEKRRRATEECRRPAALPSKVSIRQTVSSLNIVTVAD